MTMVHPKFTHDDDDDDDDWQWQITDGPHTVDSPVPRQGMCAVLARPQGLLTKTTVSIFRLKYQIQIQISSQTSRPTHQNNGQHF